MSFILFFSLLILFTLNITLSLTFLTEDKDSERPYNDIAKVLLRIKDRQPLYLGISTSLSGFFILALTVYSGIDTFVPVLSHMAPSLSPYFRDIILVVLLFVLSIIIIFAFLYLFSKIQKGIFLNNFSWIGITFYLLFWPLASLFVTVFKAAGIERMPSFNTDNLAIAFNATTPSNNAAPAVVNEVNTRILANALEFKTVRVRDCMIPRTDVVAVDVEEDIETLKKVLVESGHSKIIVFRDSIDDVIGYCHSLALFKKPENIQSIVQPLIIVPEAMLANELLIQFISQHKSIALVVDEFGGTSGIVSIEDIIEEIFGEIQDEYDDEDWVEETIDENTYLLSGRHEIDYLNETYNWKIPTGDYDTLGGFILSVTENIPKTNDVVFYPPFTFTIVSMKEKRIDTVKVAINQA